VHSLNFQAGFSGWRDRRLYPLKRVAESGGGWEWSDIGIIAVPHTWGQNLQHHPHVHCVVPGGGVSADGKRWINCRPGFFLPVRVLSRLFRRLFLEGLTAAFKADALQFFADLAHLNLAKVFSATLATLRTAEWLVYAKKTFAGPEQLLAYIAQYTHRVAITNNRFARSRGHPMSASAGGAISEAPGERIRPCALRLPSSCAASSCTSCRMAFIAFVTMDCWQTAIAPKSLRCADACSLRPFRRRLARRKATTIWAPVVISRRHALAAAVVSE
jgi:hypothetical protein